jgi:hypothetical protein
VRGDLQGDTERSRRVTDIQRGSKCYTDRGLWVFGGQMACLNGFIHLPLGVGLFGQRGLGSSGWPAWRTL